MAYIGIEISGIRPVASLVNCPGDHIFEPTFPDSISTASLTACCPVKYRCTFGVLNKERPPTYGEILDMPRR